MSYSEQFFAATSTLVDPAGSATITLGPFESYGDAADAGEASGAESFTIEKRFVAGPDTADAPVLDAPVAPADTTGGK